MYNIISYVIVSCLCLLIGLQLKVRELSLLTRKYHYRPTEAQLPTVMSAAFIVLLLYYDIFVTPFALTAFLVSVILPPLFFIVTEWFIAKLNPRYRALTWLYRFAITVICCLLILHVNATLFVSISSLTGFVLAGVYLRNSPFGAPHIKDLCMEARMARVINVHWDDQVTSDDGFPALRFAGKQIEPKEQELYDVRSYGIVPNNKADQTAAIQGAIDEIGKSGGGILHFPKGRYLLNMQGNSFLKINFSNITIEGETDQYGHPQTEFVCCKPTVRGARNPWLSPFILTTGEELQASNEVWGLDFRKKKVSFSQSNSLSDPGSDGRMLTPDVATTIVETAKKGATTLYVADSSRIEKYILIGMYNTSPDGNLLRELLGMDSFRPEWTLCQRAGNEEAPSFQWLTEVKTIVDDHHIELSRPLLRDIDIAYTPTIYNVSMLENINIRNIRFTSRWNGTFRHHGFPLYYSVRQTQEMDYGWNAINMKRVAHGEISNVVIKNFTNALYVTDSRNVTVSDVYVGGYDGHQGIKVYMHSCDNLFQHIVFTNHYADMMGGEGNAYANVFDDIAYMNAEFNPVDYDFHGFAEAPMSPPADNIFTHIYGFRYMRHAGSVSYMPSAAQGNSWIDTITEGERRGEYLFYNTAYLPKKRFIRYITAVGYAVARMQRLRQLSVKTFTKDVREKLASIDRASTSREHHIQMIPKSNVWRIKTWAKSQF